eukprot:COSAG06_NODE_53041_length_302_cov_0.960591_1_plen_76_part_00
MRRDEIVRDGIGVHVLDEIINPAVNAAGRWPSHLQLGARGLERERRVRVPAPGDALIAALIAAPGDALIAAPGDQ